MDDDLKSMSILQLQTEIMKLREGIREHRDQKGDENCWLDDQFYLYGLLPEKINADPQLPEKELMMLNCSLYYDCRKSGREYIPLTEIPPVRDPNGDRQFGKAFTNLSIEELESMIKGESHDSERNDPKTDC